MNERSGAGSEGPKAGADGRGGATPRGADGRGVARGDALLAPAITRRLVERFAAAAGGPAAAVHRDLTTLTPREREVLQQLAKGLSNAELAAELQVSEATVKTHVTRILSKLSLRDRAQAVVVAYETGLITPGAGPRPGTPGAPGTRAAPEPGGR